MNVVDARGWPERKLVSVINQMRALDLNAITIDLSSASDEPLGPGTNCDFAVVLLRGEKVKRILHAVVTASGDDAGATNPAQALESIRKVIQRHLAPMGISKHEAISEIAALLAGVPGLPSRLHAEQEDGVENGKG